MVYVAEKDMVKLLGLKEFKGTISVAFDEKDSTTSRISKITKAVLAEIDKTPAIPVKAGIA